jgi:UDP-3-O-[3-hydroxymyristoyl] glucosamine N-acyltransferase
VPPERALTADEVAHHVGGDLVGSASQRVAGVAPLDRAGPGDASFLVSRKYLAAFRETRAGTVLVARALEVRASEAPACGALVEVDDVYGALARLLPVLYPPAAPCWGIDPTATIGRGVRWEGRIAIGAGATIGAGSVLGADCVLESHVVVGARATIGPRCRLGGGALVGSDVILGAEVIVHPGARVGTEGFGFAAEAGRPRRLPHIGRCIIGDRVEIGANATVDRGSLGDTTVGDDTKIDNLVHVGHNVSVGRRCLIMAQTGIAGSSTIEDDVILAGQAGIADHLTVGQGARVAAQGGVIGNIAAGATVSGYPARDHRNVLRQAAALRRLAPLTHLLERLASGE